MTARPTTSVSDVLLAELPGRWPGITRDLGPAPPRACPRSVTAAGTFAVCGIGPAPRSAAAAREFTVRALARWRLGAFAGDIAVVVSELVGNALRHGTAASPRRPRAGRPVRLGLLWRDGTVLCAVSDPSSVPPVVREPDHLAERGRGLHIVDSLSRRWGWSPPGSAGKTVWAAVPVDGAP